MKVSVIIPIYNVESFIARCAESLMRQDFEDVEYIFVDDATPDRSIAILRGMIERYPDRKVRIVAHQQNRGLPSARNTGLAAARGEYIIHVDGDDFVEPDMLSRFVAKVEATGADFLWCDWFLSFSNAERRMTTAPASTPRAALCELLNGSMKYNVWNKMVRRSLYTDNGISFPDGKAMGEDMTMIRLAAKARNVAHVEEPLYHYVRVNTGSITQCYGEKQLEALMHNTLQTIDFLQDHVNDAGIENEIAQFKLNTKLPMLFTGNRADISRWVEWFPEANVKIMKNKAQPLRTRLLQWCAAHNLGIVNLAYSRLLYNIVYGRLYK